ncbi:MAG: aldose epimerase family protein [Thermoguttaceae bacterium]|jgi:aldose 1-epimerase
MKKSWKWWLSFAISGALLLGPGCSEQPKKSPSASSQPPANASSAEEKYFPATDAKTQPENASETTSPITPSTNESENTMSVKQEPYGKMPDGAAVDLYTLNNANGLKVKIITYGATITDVEVPDRAGKLENVALFRDSLADYMDKSTPYFGSTIGRYGNRIAKGKFTLDGKEYTLAKNNGENTLHGGLKGFDKVVWKAEPVKSKDSVGVKFTYISPDGEEGYPGTLTTQVTYSLTDKNELKMDYTATTDKPTVVNLTNHTYWNLSGAGSGDILGEEMMLNADSFLPVDAGLIPTGEIKPVKGTPMDFTTPKTIGSRIQQVGGNPGGYDHCYVLNKKEGKNALTLVAKVDDPKSGRVMEIYTTEPAVQFYTGNFLDGKITAGGKTYQKHAAFCLETQHYPDSPNQRAFPSTVLRPGETYKHFTVHKFSVE